VLSTIVACKVWIITPFGWLWALDLQMCTNLERNWRVEISVGSMTRREELKELCVLIVEKDKSQVSGT